MGEPRLEHLRSRHRPLVNGAHVSGMAAYQKLVAEADADYGAYWARLAREFVSWKTPFTNRSTTARRRSSSGSKTAR